MTIDEALNKILEIFPHATLGEDAEGQVIIYTDMSIITTDVLVHMEEK